MYYPNEKGNKIKFAVKIFLLIKEKGWFAVDEITFLGKSFYNLYLGLSNAL